MLIKFFRHHFLSYTSTEHDRIDSGRFIFSIGPELFKILSKPHFLHWQNICSAKVDLIKITHEAGLPGRI